jgi:hypothetical protein
MTHSTASETCLSECNPSSHHQTVMPSNVVQAGSRTYPGPKAYELASPRSRLQLSSDHLIFVRAHFTAYLLVYNNFWIFKLCLHWVAIAHQWFSGPSGSNLIIFQPISKQSAGPSSPKQGNKKTLYCIY